MAITLWNLFEATLLCLNAVCILHEERFLAKYGWGTGTRDSQYGEELTAKQQILHLMRSIRTVTRIPLIFFNVIVIIFKLLLG